MDVLPFIADVFLHTGLYLDTLIANYGLLVYGILFSIIFIETGIVVMPFLPGDSLIFAAAALAGTGRLDIAILVTVCIIAAIAGDALNYTIGRTIGTKMMERYPHVISARHLARASKFFEQYGGRAVILARFVPIVRTIVPFVAGAGGMRYALFTSYNVIGAVLWVCVASLAGYFLGTIPFIQENFTLMLLVVVLISVLPPIFELLRFRYIHTGVDREASH